MASSGLLKHGVPVVVTRRHGAHDSALDVQSQVDGDNNVRVRELEEENTLLAQKATAASLRYIDYENEIHQLREQLRIQHQRQNSSTSSASDPEHKHAPPVEQPGFSRLGSFMRKAALTPGHGTANTRELELGASLAREQTARLAAEAKIKEVNAEIEELSASLFQQANDMVSVERKENAALRNKIKELEASDEKLKQKLRALDKRESERKRRLEKLEAAQNRIDRVRAMLTPR